MDVAPVTNRIRCGPWLRATGHTEPVRARESFAGLVISAIEGAYIRGRAERTRTAFVEAGEWLARLIEQEAG
jgi:hypothetical protein